ncbi:hypothetical protein K450DRAFT_118957 [Umbelopsis ramanniana AG]|uniref:RNI-like protein n=1 Tax=Umbelopsis ramanniana AG TaxID=1314678 RepID=A0AAD5HBC4_UMBRA|nr:uncharacterized protein K450DRAFT_118957 [Umbelopsis ramanniana AG]KAI8576689.1 hypothetical protein K450DRAFT_118957 [Umbelopsis ramanniana AG]
MSQEHGISVRNRRFDRPRNANGAANDDEPDENAATTDDASNTETTTTTVQQTTEDTTVNILYTPTVAQQTTASATRSSRSRATKAAKAVKAAKGTKRKKRKDDEDDEDDYIDSDEDFLPLASSSTPRAGFKARAGRTRVEFCSQCKCRFSKLVLPGMEESSSSAPLLCPSCEKGETKKPEPKKRRRIARNGVVKKIGSNGYFEVASLQDISIRLIAKYIEDVEALGDIGTINMDKICKIISKNRKLSNETARLFLNPMETELSMYDCTNMTDDGFINIAQFCHRLERLKLIYCGRMTDGTISTYATHLQHLKSIELDGPFLVTNTAWKNFITSVGPRLESFALCETPRFDLDCLKVLVENCPNLKQLRLSRIVPLQDEWLPVIGKLKHLQTLEISWPSPSQTISTSSMCELIKAVGANLRELTLQCCVRLTDEVLTEAILPTCSKLTTLNLSECDGFTSDGIKAVFDGWVEQKSNLGLIDLNLTRCTKLNDEAIESVLRHSRKTLSAFSINSLDEVSSRALEAIAGEGDGASPCLALRFFDCGFVRALDDIVMDKLVKSCNALEHLKVWGCHKLTECVPIRPGLRVEGRESDTS